jgi:hypothetical protein
MGHMGHHPQTVRATAVVALNYVIGYRNGVEEVGAVLEQRVVGQFGGGRRIWRQSDRFATTSHSSKSM